jgi:hypothetical protein
MHVPAKNWRDNSSQYFTLWQYELWSFQTGGTKLEKILPKNQHTQMILLNFENWVNGRCQNLGIILVSKVIQKLTLSKNVNNKKFAPKLIFFNEKN